MCEVWRCVCVRYGGCGSVEGADVWMCGRFGCVGGVDVWEVWICGCVGGVDVWEKWMCGRCECLVRGGGVRGVGHVGVWKMCV